MRNVLTIMMCAWAPVLWIGAPHAQGSVQTAAPAAALSGVVMYDTGSIGAGLGATASKTGIKGNIKDVMQGGAAVEGATIMYVGSGEGNSGEVASDPNGEFEIVPLAPGEYSLNVVADGYRAREDIIRTVIAGQLTPVEVKMREKTTLLRFARRFDWDGVLILLSSVAVIALIFTLTASWLMRKAERQS